MVKERILTYNEIDREEWSRLVATSATGTWFQTPEAYCFFASMPDLFRPFVVGLAYPRPLPKGKGEKPNPAPSLKGRESTAQVSFAAVLGAHTADSTQYDLLEANARKNRKNPTEAENVLWGLLKGNNIGLHFRRQHVILDYIVDFICLEKGLVIELDGGYHNDKEQKEYDEQRTAHLQKLGYTELRFTNEELLVNPEGVIARIKSVASSLPSLKGTTEDRLVLRGVCVGYVTKEKSAIKQFFTRRAIIIGGPALADDATDEEVEALMGAVKDSLSFTHSLIHSFIHSPIYIETRNFNDYGRWKEAFEKVGFNYYPHLNFHVDCTDMETMWERMSKNRKRQIRRVMNDSATELVSERVVAEQDVREWYAILADLYRTRVKTPLWPVNFFINAFQQKVGVFLLVKHQGRVIGGSFCVVLKKIPLTHQQSPISTSGGVYEWFESGRNAQYKDQYPSVFATFAGMCYAAEHGIPRYDMMGAGVPGVPYGVRDFKSEFGGKMVEHGRFVYVYKPLLYEIGKALVKIIKK